MNPMTSTPRTRRRPPERIADSKVLLRAVGIVAALFTAGYLLSVYVVFPPLSVPVDGTVVPNLVGRSVSDARRELATLGLTVTDSIQFPHPTVAQGLILAQDPLPGQQLRTRGTVRVGVSTGLPSVMVPDVVGLSVDRATRLLGRLGFEVNQTFEESERAAGVVTRTAPAAGANESLPARVLLVVSTGPALMPDTMASAFPPDTGLSIPPQ